MNDSDLIDQMRRAIESYKFTLVIMGAILVLVCLTFAFILLYTVPSIVSKSVSATSDARREALLGQIHDTVIQAINDKFPE